MWHGSPISGIVMSHMYESCHIWKSHEPRSTFTNPTQLTDKWNNSSMLHMDESCHIWASQTTYEWVWHGSPICGMTRQCVAVCCSVLQCVAVCCSMWNDSSMPFFVRHGSFICDVTVAPTYVTWPLNARLHESWLVHMWRDWLIQAHMPTNQTRRNNWF